MICYSNATGEVERLKKLLVTKKEPVTNLKILVYRCPGEVERLTKIMEHADVQLVQCMQQIKNLVAEKDICNKELADLKTVAQAVVDMVDPPEGSVEEGRTLLERLQAAPQRITNSRRPPGSIACFRFSQILLARGELEATWRRYAPRVRRREVCYSY